MFRRTDRIPGSKSDPLHQDRHLRRGPDDDRESSVNPTVARIRHIELENAVDTIAIEHASQNRQNTLIVGISAAVGPTM